MRLACAFLISLQYGLYTVYTFCVLSALAENPCKIIHEKADCSHLKLSAIPSSLPSYIKELDLSHNQLKQLPPANLSRYDQLGILDVGYNLLHQLDPLLCVKLPQLNKLNLQHNEFTKITEKYFTSCANLIELYLASNSINGISGNPFQKLENLCVLDMSHNKMTSTSLGNNQQLPNLQELLFSSNKITALGKEGFSFLANNNSLRILTLSSNYLKIISNDSFNAIPSLHTLVMDNMQLGPNLVEALSSALAGTEIQVLSLINVQLARIHNTTFNKLENTNLISLNISKNSLLEIDDKSFGTLKYLETLNLEHNQVSHISPYTFYGLSNLKSLYLGQFFNTTKASRIDDLSFQWMTNLEYLNMGDNKIPGFTENTFTNLTSLKMLNLSECNGNLQTITKKTFVSLSNSPLLVLLLTKTGIAKLENEAFSSLSQLQNLDLGLNRINQELFGLEFLGLQSIEVLYLSYNNRLAINRNSFIYVPSLKKLYLRKSGLTFTEFDPSPFNNLTSLTLLDLSNNNIANIEENVFKGLTNLRILNFQHNNLARLWKNANPGGPVLFLNGLYNLEILSLLSNGFDEIPDIAFKGLLNLSTLELGENNINIMPQSLFNDQRSLSVLDLHKNLITAVEKDTFKNVFSSLGNLSMGGNPFDCTCESIAWFSDWLNKTNISVTGLDTQYICNTPPRYHGIAVQHFDSSSCKDKSPYVLFILTFSFLISFILLTLIIHFQGWRIQFYWNVSMHRLLGFKEIDQGNENFDYDAYIIHAKIDNVWVEKNLLTPLEDDDRSKFQFCFEERDFVAGDSHFSAIVNSIRRSRKIIFVITEHFLNDPWCNRFKVHQAFQQAIEQSRDSIILIFLEDIPDYKLHHTINLRRGMFTSRCTLYWPAQKERINLFHQKLKIAIGSTNIIS
ncbi:toll-like receptor 3 [Discoglossus pictus]